MRAALAKQAPRKLPGVTVISGHPGRAKPRGHFVFVFVATSERDQREPESNEGSSRARSEATRVRAAPAIFLGAPDVCFDGLASLQTSERNGTEAEPAKLK